MNIRNRNTIFFLEVVILIEKIAELREKGYSFRKIAQELGTTVGKVQYRYHKYKEQVLSQHQVETTVGQNNDLHAKKESQSPQDKSPDHGETPMITYYEPPSTYDKDSLVLLPKSPFILHAFWDIQLSTQQMVEHQFRKPWSSLKKQLKIYDITAMHFDGHHAHRSDTITLPEMTNNWYISELEPNRTYLADYGVETDEGNFFSLIRSNAMDTSRIKKSERGLYSEAVYKWKTGQAKEPEWLEHFSTYSFYESIK
ncbi:hypothetical protein AJ85_05035 [Alkalihalobacillus alcalophilus ATCC 27647 = CGMCC 1.3604]|uniref:DUF4912 domain-containing protein n=1 Tax=Alkalihalobacillus alcalophilus ATCC 27647 = CGMCC 1.3604 TaxID=1218173 RepID=A0A4S4K5M3_ALKAL|nr:hypothetical protein AJ85_05035 [Alkalihalobacillus alcalophilus ATCC 27647 = CGMCC 1.3604]